MAVLNYVKRFLRRQVPKAPVEYVREDHRPVVSSNQENGNAAELHQLESEIDLSHQADLEGYARGLSISKGSIERWISSGLLMPDEMKVAEKLVKLMNKQ